MFEENYFKRRKMNVSRLISYGFEKQGDGYRYRKPVMNGQFLLYVFITDHGVVSTQMIDCATKEEYVLYKVPSSAGAFVGEVRAACGQVLTDISEKCFEPDVFHSQQTLAVIQYVRETYGDELEFLWEKSPGNAIWRRRDTQKWYGIIMTVSKRKLGLAADETAEILDLRLSPERMKDTIDNRRYFPGWHMNKKSWYTMILDGTVPTTEICRRIEDSYMLAVK